MTASSLFFTMAAIGIAETAYLIGERYASRKPICPIGGGCAQVLESKYNKLLGVYNDVLGLVFYLGVSTLSAIIVVGIGPLPLLNQIVSAATLVALLLSVRFFYLQWRVIRAWCFWCLLSSLTILIMSIILLTHAFILTPYAN
ncbi:hypothetical protein HY631_03045 [Candidatus Uhrbacteria bacterium]|nr:hypothetical protein [Candidatus Uhrbacteria bacterium]